jgi:sialate O-acetylesterase
MKRTSPLLFALSAIALLAIPAQAEKMPKEDVIEIPSIGKGLWVSNTFQTNMVLQRDKPIHIWGWAAPGEKVTVSFDGNSTSATAAKDRTWKVTLPELPANAKPQTMTIKGKVKTVTLDNILLGDVWILSGQSNMEHPLSKIEDGNLEIISANFPEIRILTLPKGVLNEPVAGFARVHEWSSWTKGHDRKGDWDVCTPEIAKDLSAIGYVFARRVHKASGVPIGVIDASSGGTTVETWAPLEALRKMDSAPVKAMLADWDQKVAAWDPKADLKKRIEGKKDWLKRMQKDGRAVDDAGKILPTELLPGPIASKHHPGACYAGMIKPIAGLSVKGAIWHQGYNNAFGGLNGTPMYLDVFPEMIKTWRTAFNDAKMPFGILSLCTAGNPQTLENYSESMLNYGIGIREAQYTTFLNLYKAGDKNIGFVSTYDFRRRWYHPQLKIHAGERIARWALATQYDFANILKWKPPVITSMEAKDSTITLSFDSAMSDPEDGAMVGFAIAGEDRKFYPATATHAEKGKDSRGRIESDTKKLILTSPMVQNPVNFRYAWGRNPLANLQIAGHTDVPLATQRSDDWPTHTVPLGALPKDVELPLERGDLRKLTLALKEQDKQRRIREAELTIEALGK